MLSKAGLCINVGHILSAQKQLHAAVKFHSELVQPDEIGYIYVDVFYIPDPSNRLKDNKLLSKALQKIQMPTYHTYLAL